MKSQSGFSLVIASQPFYIIFCRENDLRTLFCPNTINAHFCCKNDLSTLFLLQKNLRTLFCREDVLHAFFCLENDLRISSGKFLRVESCHPEGSDFWGLCPQCYDKSLTICQ